MLTFIDLVHKSLNRMQECVSELSDFHQIGSKFGLQCMVIKRPEWLKPSDITDESVYRNRRQFLAKTPKIAIVVAASITLPELIGINNARTALTLGDINKSTSVFGEEKTP